MKANRRLRSPIVLAAVVIAATLASSCSDRRVIPTPAPSPTPRPTPAPTSTPVQPSADWRDAPITPGVWNWSKDGGRSAARFAGGLLELRCDATAGTVTLLRRGAASGQTPVTIRTTSTARGFAGAGHPDAVAVTFAARDGILDAMAFSRGRFAVEAAGMPPVYAPSWPEVSRVIDDCR